MSSRRPRAGGGGGVGTPNSRLERVLAASMRVRGTAGERVSYESDESSDLKIKYYKEEARDYLRKRACYVLFKRREDSMQGLSTMGDNNEELLNAIKDVVLGDFEIEGDNAWKHFPEHGITEEDIK